MNNPYKTLNSKIDYQNKYFKVRRDEIVHPNGNPGVYYVVEFPSPVFVVSVSDKQEIYLVGLYRYTTNMYSWELPAGGSEGKDELQAAKRELLEETGVTAKKWEMVGTFQVSNGNCNKIAHTFVAQGLQESDDHKKEEEGITEVKKVPFREVLQMIKDGQITDADSIAAVMQAAIHLQMI